MVNAMNRSLLLSCQLGSAVNECLSCWIRICGCCGYLLHSYPESTPPLPAYPLERPLSSSTAIDLKRILGRLSSPSRLSSANRFPVRRSFVVSEYAEVEDDDEGR